jgi:membrane-associated phospholipid phosphatase
MDRLKQRFIPSSSADFAEHATPEANYSRAFCHARPACAHVLLVLSLAGIIARPAPLVAQDDAGHAIQWWHGAVAVGGLSMLMLLDHPIQRFASHNSGTGADNVASIVRHMGQAEVYAGVPIGIAAVGLVTGNSRMLRTAKLVGSSVLLAGATIATSKFAFGRPRPDGSLDADGFSPFSGQTSMPSGHTAAAFALATSLSDEIHNPLATVGLYGLATATGWSRINDNRHWFTDVAAGALVGITSAKLMSGKWRIFGLRAPSIGASPNGRLSFGWKGEF